jgi:1-acyl-sn-glycerol-3-phosphate acyltransferase
MASLSLGARAARATLMAMGGWRLVGEPPTCRRAVCLAFPHSDNMDGVLLVLLARSVDLQISWMVKDAWGRGITGPAIRGLGGVPIDRSKPSGMVGQMVDAFGQADQLYLVVPPEGTRSHTEHWKSGFYHIALGAQVPVVCGLLDYRTKTGSFGPPIEMTGVVRDDMDRIRAYYRDAVGGDPAQAARYPDKCGPMRLREEDQ